MDDMHIQDAKHDMALEVELRNPWGEALADSVCPTSGRDCSHARTMAGRNKLANNSIGELSPTAIPARLKVGL